MSLNKLADEFNAQYGLKQKPLDSDLTSMVGLIGDEWNELDMEILAYTDQINLNNVVKEAIDTIYITMQQLRERGVDVDAALAEVHRSNMSKSLDIYDNTAAFKELDIARKRYPAAQLIPHGDKYILKCAESGKVIKPSCYSPAVITKQMIGE